jgi:hypothetical protein
MKMLMLVLVIAAVTSVACGGSSASGGSSDAADGAFVSSSGDARSEGCLEPAATAGFNGQLVLVCGTVAEVAFAEAQNRSTFVYFDGAPPGHSFTAVISGGSRSGFNPFPEDQFTPGTHVCIEGKVQIDGDGKPIIDVQSALNMLIIPAPEIHGEHCTGN